MYLNLIRTIKSLFSLGKYKHQIEAKTINLFLDAIQLHTTHLIKEKTFNFDDVELESIKRGNIVWVDFGFNVGHEFGGKHPALILKYINDGEDLYVVPLDSGKLPENKKKENGKPKNGFVEIPMIDNKCVTVFNMDKMHRWCNVNRLRCISWVRIDFNSPVGRMRSDYISKIEEEILRNQYKPIINNKKVLTKEIS
jgi:mRNA-degrading endonuclease toxin of MazEF toxin-antitoxin module